MIAGTYERPECKLARLRPEYTMMKTAALNHPVDPYLSTGKSRRRRSQEWQDEINDVLRAIREKRGSFLYFCSSLSSVYKVVNKIVYLLGIKSRNSRLRRVMLKKLRKKWRKLRSETSSLNTKSLVFGDQSASYCYSKEDLLKPSRLTHPKLLLAHLKPDSDAELDSSGKNSVLSRYCDATYM